MTKISVTRALAELKVLPDRIKTAAQALASTAVDVKVGRTSNVTRTGIPFATFEENQTKAFQSLNDMIKRRERLKALIIKSNAVTTVNFLGETITVAEAIERKSSLELKNQVLAHLRAYRATAENTKNSLNARLDESIEKQLNTLFGNDKGKVDQASVEAVQNTLRDRQEASIVGLAKLDNQIETLYNQVQAEQVELDFLLSEINAKTEIEI